MGGQRDVNDAPPITEYGFDRSLTNFEGMGAKLLPLTLTPQSKEPGRIWQDAVNLGRPVTWMQRSEITAGFVEAALEFIDRAEATNQPFFVNVWPDDVHSPFFPPLDRWGDDKRALYYAVLKTMDEQLGVLFDRIRNDDKLRNNTLIVFCSDNGHEPGAGKSDPLRGAKTWLYDGGIRSPLIVWGPGLMAEGGAGTTNDESVFSAMDVNRAYYDLTDARCLRVTNWTAKTFPRRCSGNRSKAVKRRSSSAVLPIVPATIRRGAWVTIPTWPCAMASGNS
jgi:hypothetical protein